MFALDQKITIGFGVFFLSLFSISLHAQSPQLKFKIENFNLDNGLTDIGVQDIIQDSQGFLWLSSNNALLRYDGYEFYPYRSNLKDENSYWGWGRAILQDKEGILWIGSDNCLNRFDPQDESFVHFRFFHNDPTAIHPSYQVWQAFQDSQGGLWATTLGNGLHKIISGKDSTAFLPFLHHSADPESISDNVVFAMIEDENGYFWLGTNRGVNRFDPRTNIFTHYLYDEIADALYGYLVPEVFLSQDGTLWAGTSGDGMIEVRLKNSVPQEIIHYKHDPADPYSLRSNKVNDIVEIEPGILWIGTEAGVSIFDTATRKFYEIARVPGVNEKFWSSQVSRIFKDGSNVVWIATRSDGLFKLTPVKKRIDHYYEKLEIVQKDFVWQDNFIWSMCEDHAGNLWIGTENGLKLLEAQTRQLKFFLHDPEDAASIQSNFVSTVYEDRNGNLWIGTYTGLDRYDQNHQDFHHFVSIDFEYLPADAPLIEEQFINTIREDEEGNLWIGTWEGLFRINFNDSTIHHYAPEEGNPKSLNGHRIHFLYFDDQGDLWLGTPQGISRFNRSTYDFTHFPGINASAILKDSSGRIWVGGFESGLALLDPENEVFHPLPETHPFSKVICISDILEDRHGFLWISTCLEGLWKYNPETGFSKRFTLAEGLQGYSFRWNTAFQNKEEKMFFGGDNGFNVFHPDSLLTDMLPSPVVLTHFKAFNQRIRPGKDSVLPQNISSSQTITLPYHMNIFSLEFAALNFFQPDQNRYAYKLEGFQDEWIFTGATQREATYTNLSPGEYTFRVKACDHEGIWNEQGASLKLIITPPPWQTWWAYTLYVLAFLGFIYGLRKYELKRIRLNHQLQMKSMEALRLAEVDAMKSRFFANISHEFRTPLTLILGPVDRLIKKFADDSAERKEFLLIKRNAKRLLALINQLLDIAKIESGSMKLEASENDLIAFLRPILLSFESLAESKKIDYEFDFAFESLDLYFDADKLEKIISNLVSNALKFTPKGGKVCIEVLAFEGEKPGLVAIKVMDSGIGIPPDELNNIFDRFYQIDSSHRREGTGIGLALTKELVSLHHGEILAESRIDSGSVFTVVLPLGKDHLAPEEIVEKASDEKPVPEVDAFEETETHGEEKKIKENESIILVVEDNRDLREYIKLNITDHPKTRHFKVAEAINGKEGLTQALLLIPDLIVTDLMMPEMDGLTLCAQLKRDERTSHIPVVMLTAKAGSKSKLESLESGADDYISKPFDAEELMARITNLISQRELLKKKYTQSLTFEPEKIAVNSVDQRFLERVKNILENRMDDPALDVDDFSREIGMSRSQFYRKLKSLLGQSPNQFLREMRLARAAQLFDEHFGTVAEVAYAVGFNNLSYFTRSFKDKFHQLPSEYIS